MDGESAERVTGSMQVEHIEYIADCSMRERMTCHEGYQSSSVFVEKEKPGIWDLVYLAWIHGALLVRMLILNYSDFCLIFVRTTR